MQFSEFPKHIRSCRQSNSRRHVRLKVSGELKFVLDDTKREAVTILSTARDNRSWTNDGFRSLWGKACARAGIEGLTFHDLCGTFVTLAYRVGSSIKEIAEVSGHSKRDAESTIKRHYLAGENAVTRMETVNQERGKV